MNVRESYSCAFKSKDLCSSPSVDHRGMLMNSAAPLNHVRCDVGAVINGLWRGEEEAGSVVLLRETGSTYRKRVKRG